MEFIETHIFAKESKSLLSEESVRHLQTSLMLFPATGVVIPGSGGLRKLRWVSATKGKKGGLRIIYYWITDDDIIILLHIYKKAKQEDLTSDQIKYLKSLVEEELNG